MVEKFTASSAAVSVPAAAAPTAVALPAFGAPTREVRISNPGTVHAHVEFGTAAVVATAASPYVVLQGESAVFTVPAATHVSAYSTGTPTLYVVLGNGE